MTGKHGDFTQDEDVLSRDLDGSDISRYTCHFYLSCVSMPELCTCAHLVFTPFLLEHLWLESCPCL